MGTQYLQVDLLSVHILSGFSTRGTVIDKFWVSRYLVRYSLNGMDWILIKDYDGKDEVTLTEFMSNYMFYVPHQIKYNCCCDYRDARALIGRRLCHI